MKPDAIFWFRRDLNLDDNIGLYKALKENNDVLPVFIFDSNILEKLDQDDKRVHAIYMLIEKLKKELINLDSNIDIFHGFPEDYFKSIPDSVKCVYTNEDYEPYARSRDDKISKILSSKNIAFKSFKNQVIFEKGEILKDDGTPYVVYTPYMKKWKASLQRKDLESKNIHDLKTSFLRFSANNFNFSKLGFPKTANQLPLTPNHDIITTYDQTRDIPSIQGTSRLSFALRFGAISIRKLVKNALSLNETFLNELIWREFYMMILWHFPHVVDSAFKKQYDNIEWINDEKQFQKWCEGNTGIPIVDAGMRELNSTGYMHNRVRMIVASFLVKNLLIDWRWGEAYFAKRLLDYELASNNGGWQWAAGSGCDAAPYFRIFNPISQAKKFDPESNYINKWVPETKKGTYHPPIIDLSTSRKRALDVYKKALA